MSTKFISLPIDMQMSDWFILDYIDEISCFRNADACWWYNSCSGDIALRTKQQELEKNAFETIGMFKYVFEVKHQEKKAQLVNFYFILFKLRNVNFNGTWVMSFGCFNIFFRNWMTCIYNLLELFIFSV